MSASWKLTELAHREGLQRGTKIATTTALIGAGAMVGVGATATPAGATLPPQANMYHMGTTIADNGSFAVGTWNAVDRSAAWLNSITKCADGNGSFKELISHVDSAIRNGYQVVAGIAVRNGDTCGGSATPISKWENKAKDIINSVEKTSGWQRYFGGVVLDEEGGFGYTPSSVETMNYGIEDWEVSQNKFGSRSTVGTYGQYFGSYSTIWDNYSNYANVEVYTRPMPEFYVGSGASDPTMVALAEGACTMHSVCAVAPTVAGFNGHSQTVPTMSSRITGEIIPGWGTGDWYERYTL